MITRLKPILVTGIIATSIGLCLNWPGRVVSADENDTTQQIGKGMVDWTTGVVRVTGGGAPPEKGGMAQKRLMARRAAQADAYRQLAEVLNGVHVDSETSVKDFVTQSDTIRTSVSALVKGAMAVATRNMSDGSVEVDVETKMYGTNGLFSAVAPWENRKPGPPPTVQVPDEQGMNVLPASVLVAANGNFQGLPTLLADARPTGVILDTHGLNLEPCMSPSILDPGKGELYLGRNQIDPDYVVNVGIASYYQSIDQAKGDHERVGTNPLVVRTKKVSGPFRCDAELGSEDAIAVLLAERRNKVLKGTKVGFVM